MNKISTVNDANFFQKQDQQFIYVQMTHNPADFHMPSSHIHDHYEIYFLVEGRTNYIVDDKLYAISTHDIMLIPPGVPHRSSCESAVTRLLVSFDKRALPEESSRELLRVFEHFYYSIPTSGVDHIHRIFRDLLREWEMKDEFSKENLKRLLEILLTELLRLPHPTATSVSSADPTIQKALTYISTNIEERLSLEDIAEHVGLNASYFSRKFKSTTGLNYHKYLLLIRISRAQKLLAETKYSVTDIAGMCGFNDSNYFSTAFRRIINMSPNQFREYHHVNKI